MWNYLKSSRGFWIGVGLTVAALVCFGFAVSEFRIEGKLGAEGVQANATVIDKTETTGRRGKKTRRVRLRFTDTNGREHATVHSSSALWAKAIGETVPIVYLRSDPRQNRVEGDPKWPVYSFIGGTLAAIGLLLLGRSFVRAKRLTKVI